MSSTEIGCDGEANAYLIAGRAFGNGGKVTVEAYNELQKRVVEVATEIGQPLVLVQAGDPLSSGKFDKCAVGLMLARADSYEFTAISHDELTSGLARAHELPWELIAEHLFQGSHKQPSPSDTALHATSRGPLAGVFVGYGALVELREPGSYPDWDNDEEQRFRDDDTGVAAGVPDLDLVRGNMMDQLPQVDAVYGVLVASALYDDRPPVTVDISEQAHRERVAKLGELSDRSTYYLVSHYD